MTALYRDRRGSGGGGNPRCNVYKLLPFTSNPDSAARRWRSLALYACVWYFFHFYLCCLYMYMVTVSILLCRSLEAGTLIRQFWVSNFCDLFSLSL